MTPIIVISAGVAIMFSLSIIKAWIWLSNRMWIWPELRRLELLEFQTTIIDGLKLVVEALDRFTQAQKLAAKSLKQFPSGGVVHDESIRNP